MTALPVLFFRFYTATGGKPVSALALPAFPMVRRQTTDNPAANSVVLSVEPPCCSDFTNTSHAFNSILPLTHYYFPRALLKRTTNH